MASCLAIIWMKLFLYSFQIHVYWVPPVIVTLSLQPPEHCRHSVVDIVYHVQGRVPVLSQVTNLSGPYVGELHQVLTANLWSHSWHKTFWWSDNSWTNTTWEQFAGIRVKSKWNKYMNDATLNLPHWYLSSIQDTTSFFHLCPIKNWFAQTQDDRIPVYKCQ